MGSVVGLSVGSTLVQNTLRVVLRDRLAGRVDDIDKLVRAVRESLDYIDSLDPTTAGIVRGSYGLAVGAAFIASIILASAAFFTSFFISEKPLPTRVQRD